ncbi:MAG: glycoside hydrolase family 71/99-like protein, partial [Limisphaerales bacterium]
MQLLSRFRVLLVVFAVLICCTVDAIAQTVDNSTLSNKFIIGYQGWHAAQGDGDPVGGYIHWSHSSAAPSTSDSVDDIWPDLTEFTAGELFSTGLTLGNGQAAKVYSAYLGQTVNRHFAWMKTNGIDGVFAQRFTKDVFTDANWSALKNQVLVNVKNAAETNGRIFCVEYDISNDPTNVAISHLQSDWAYLTGTLGITNSSRYLKHKGKPLVGIWGLGFSNIPSSTAMYTPAQALTIISNFHAAGCTVMGGVPYWWRLLINDAQADTNWLTVYKSFDIINPWAVGRYQNSSQMDSFRSSIVAPDLAWCVSNNVDYLPVIFPGYSSANLNGAGSTSNSAPRLAGSFYWRQAYDNLSSGCKMLFGAMFDEIDEGTAIYKLAPTMSTVPQYTNMFALNVDGTSLPSDWYLQVAGQITKAAHGGPLNSVLPITPTNSITVTSPNGGEFWFSGSTATVTWSSAGTVGNVSIDLSTDGGQSFRSLAYNVANNGSNTVTVPFWTGTNCLVRVQGLSGAPADWSDAAFTIKTNSQNGSTHLESMWNIAPGSVPYISTGASAVERGLAYNALSNELVIVHHGTDGLSVNVIDADTGAFKKVLNTSGVTQGGFLLDRVGVTGDGVIYAANVQTSVSGSAPFKVYRWANSDPNTVPTVAYSGTAGFPNASRVGDCFALRGAGSNTQILIGSRAANTASLLTTANGTNFSATLYTSDAPANTFGLSVAFDSTNTFWGKTNGLPLTKVSYNTTNFTATTIQTITNLPNFGTFGVDPANKLLAA